MQHVICHPVEKVAVVCNEQQGAAVAAKPLFQPQYCIQIQMIGRFIEQQQVGAAHQRLRQVEAHTPTAGKLVGRTLLIIDRKSQAVQQARST